jgi:FtsZ-binding cell division protein ZapB
MEGFEVLEKEINRAMELIDIWKLERSEALTQAEESRERLSGMEAQNEILKSENAQLREEHQKAMALVEEKKEKVKAQIERMLAKLESESG